jgi:lipid-A-disaccharide synthase
MATPDLSPAIFLSVAEQSADEHAAALVRAVQQRQPGARFAGLAGPALQAAGCECYRDLTVTSAMALAAFWKVPSSLLLLHRLKGYLAGRRFDAAVVVDSPALNLPIARLCRWLGIPVLYYIAPQTWAWGSRARRNARIRARVSRLACIWPFEEAYFRADGIAADYVGHPSFDHLLAEPADEARSAALRGGAAPVVALLPGSRPHVLREVLPGQLEVATALSRRFHRARFLVVAANAGARDTIQSSLAALRPRLSAAVVEGARDRAAAIAAADLALVASGTITLEVAWRATPMIVMYNTNRWSYELVGRWFITTPHLSIPNILAGRRVVPEFMPYYRTVDPIIAQAVEWLSTPGALDRVRRELRQVIQPIVKPGAADNTAAILEELVDPSAGVRAPVVSGQ